VSFSIIAVLSTAAAGSQTLESADGRFTPPNGISSVCERLRGINLAHFISLSHHHPYCRFVRRNSLLLTHKFRLCSLGSQCLAPAVNVTSNCVFITPTITRPCWPDKVYTTISPCLFLFMSLLIKIASGRIISSGVHSGANTAKRSATASNSNSDTLGSAAKLGQVGRDKERKEKEDVELKPPWELSPYCREPSAGKPRISYFSDPYRISRLLSFKGYGRRIYTHGENDNRWI
jgi:hypothetical protein